MANLTLGELIDWLEKQDQSLIVDNGFSSGHSDRGYYEDLGFTPVPVTTLGEMLTHARAADGAVMEGWKGGEFRMGRHTHVHIGEYGTCGESITHTHLVYWLDTGATP